VKPEVKPEAPPEIPMVSLNLVITPADAVVEIDGLVIKDNPIKLPKSDVPVKVKVSRPGFVAEMREVKPVLDGDLKFDLKKEKKDTGKGGSGKPRRNIGPREDDL
jgi:hypothetical protein